MACVGLFALVFAGMWRGEWGWVGEGVYAPPCKVNNCFMMLATQIFHAKCILFTQVGSRGVEAVDAPLSPLSVVVATGTN